MLRFTDNKLNWKPSSEINISEQRRLGKTCMTGKVINMADGQYRQGVFSPPEKVNYSGEEEPQRVQEGYKQMITPCIFINLFQVHSHALLPFIMLQCLTQVFRRRLSSMTNIKLSQLPKNSEHFKKWYSRAISSTTPKIKHLTVFQKCWKLWSYFLLLC